MEFIFFILIIIFLWNLLSSHLMNDDSSSSMNNTNRLQLKIMEVPSSEKSENFADTKMYGIYIKGDPGIDDQKVKNYYSCVKVYDEDGNASINSTLRDMADSGGGFEGLLPIGDMNGKYWPEWTRISILIQETLIGPYKGNRRLRAECTFWPETQLPFYSAGILQFADSATAYQKTFFKTGFTKMATASFDFNLINCGYLELDEDKLTIQKASVRLALSIAYADGSLDMKERTLIKKWIINAIQWTASNQEEKVKNALNNELDQSLKDGKKNTIDIAKVCNEIVNIGSRADKISLIELCLDVMAVDGEANKEELKQIEKISSLIGIDYDDITKMKDQRLVKLDPSSEFFDSLEEILGIDPDWDKNKIQKHLITIYGKWNAKVGVLQEGVKKDNAQKMLNLIAEAKKKYL